MLLELRRAKMEAAKGVAAAVIIGSGQDSALATQNVTIGPAAPTAPGSLQEMRSFYLTTHLLNQNDQILHINKFLRGICVQYSLENTAPKDISPVQPSGKPCLRNTMADWLCSSD